MRALWDWNWKSATVGSVAVTVVGLYLAPFYRAAMLYRCRLLVDKKACVRKMALQTFRAHLQSLEDQQYLVVTGPKGIGKSFLIDKALEDVPGVVEVNVIPEKVDFVALAEKEIRQWEVRNYMTGAPLISARAVIFRYQQMFNHRPVVIFRVREISPGQTPVPLQGVAKVVSALNIDVIVDASTNSLAIDVLKTGRQRVFDVPPMTWDEINEVEQLKKLFELLVAWESRLKGLTTAIQRLIGGNPVLMAQLLGEVKAQQLLGPEKDKEYAQGEEFARCVVVGHLLNLIDQEKREVINFFAEYPHFEATGKMFEAGAPRVYLDDVDPKLQKLPVPCRIFRTVYDQSAKESFLVPAREAVGFILRLKLHKSTKLRKSTPEESKALVNWENLKALVDADKPAGLTTWVGTGNHMMK